MALLWCCCLLMGHVLAHSQSSKTTSAEKFQSFKPMHVAPWSGFQNLHKIAENKTTKNFHSENAHNFELSTRNKSLYHFKPQAQQNKLIKKKKRHLNSAKRRYGKKTDQQKKGYVQRLAHFSKVIKKGLMNSSRNENDRRGFLEALNGANISVENHVHSQTVKSSIHNNGKWSTRGLLDALKGANISVENHVHSQTVKSSIHNNGKWSTRGLLDALKGANISVENHVHSQTVKSNIHNNGKWSTRGLLDALKGANISVENHVHSQTIKSKVDSHRRGLLDALKGANISVQNHIHTHTVKSGVHHNTKNLARKFLIEATKSSHEKTKPNLEAKKNKESAAVEVTGSKRDETFSDDSIEMKGTNPLDIAEQINSNDRSLFHIPELEKAATRNSVGSDDEDDHEGNDDFSFDSNYGPKPHDNEEEQGHYHNDGSNQEHDDSTHNSEENHHHQSPHADDWTPFHAAPDLKEFGFPINSYIHDDGNLHDDHEGHKDHHTDKFSDDEGHKDHHTDHFSDDEHHEKGDHPDHEETHDDHPEHEETHDDHPEHEETHDGHFEGTGSSDDHKDDHSPLNPNLKELGFPVNSYINGNPNSHHDGHGDEDSHHHGDRQGEGTVPIHDRGNDAHFQNGQGFSKYYPQAEDRNRMSGPGTGLSGYSEHDGSHEDGGPVFGSVHGNLCVTKRDGICQDHVGDHHEDHHDDQGNSHHLSFAERMIQFQRNPFDPHDIDINYHHDEDELHHEAVDSPIPQSVLQIGIDPANHLHYMSRGEHHDLHHENSLFHDDHDEGNYHNIEDGLTYHHDPHELIEGDYAARALRISPHEEHHGHNGNHEYNHPVYDHVHQVTDHGNFEHDHNGLYHGEHDVGHGRVYSGGYVGHGDEDGHGHVGDTEGHAGYSWDHGNHHENHDTGHDIGHDFGHHSEDQDGGFEGHGHGNHGDSHEHHEDNDGHGEGHNSRLAYEQHHTYPASTHQAPFLPIFSPPQRILPMFQVEHPHYTDGYHDHHSTGDRRGSLSSDGQNIVPLTGQSDVQNTGQTMSVGDRDTAMYSTQHLNDYLKKAIYDYGVLSLEQPDVSASKRKLGSDAQTVLNHTSVSKQLNQNTSSTTIMDLSKASQSNTETSKLYNQSLSKASSDDKRPSTSLTDKSIASYLSKKIQLVLAEESDKTQETGTRRKTITASKRKKV